MKKSEIKALIFIVFIIILFLINSFFTKIFSDYGIVAFLIFMVGIAWLLFGLSKFWADFFQIIPINDEFLT